MTREESSTQSGIRAALGPGRWTNPMLQNWFTTLAGDVPVAGPGSRGPLAGHC
jgi:hypothetical protein